MTTTGFRQVRRVEKIVSPQRRVTSASARVMLWRPEIVLAHTIGPSAPGPGVTIAGPADRPAAVGARIEAAQSLLSSLTEARATLGVQAAQAQTRIRGARSTRERVTATMASYRVEAALDDVLSGTLRKVTALMEDRGL